MSTRLTVVDAFTHEPFRGNPAAVCLLDAPRGERWMQAVAREMNLSETAFLLSADAAPDGDDGRTWRRRWFTPGGEVNLCGHATLAAARVLADDGLLPAGETARFTTLSGPLSARLAGGGWIELDFPAEPPQAVTPPAGLLAALGLPGGTGAPRWVGRNRLDWLVEVADERAVRAAEPDFRALAALDARGAMITSGAEAPGVDFVSRYFAPAFGIDEDPVTGSAHCCSGPYWAGKLGRDELTAYQASARGGTVKVEVRGERVMLGGQAVPVSRVELLV